VILFHEAFADLERLAGELGSFVDRKELRHGRVGEWPAKDTTAAAFRNGAETVP
jgi:hypothetical protein